MKQKALDYHSQGRRGKIEVISSKPCNTQKDLSLAYTPGVAEPCREIEADPEAAYKYTAKGNLVAVISNGTAVLGLGDIGPLAGKPVMEGKGILFKRFADIDVFDLEIDAKDPDDVIKIVASLEPTFGGINLEDIKAPECFYIEEELKKITNKDVQINIFEIKRPELDAKLVGESIAQQLSARISYRRAMKQAIASSMRVGAQGIKVKVSGRLGGAEMARTEQYKDGRIPLHTLRAEIDYAISEAETVYGKIGIKVWIFKGEVYGKRDLSPNVGMPNQPSRNAGPAPRGRRNDLPKRRRKN